MNGENVGTGLFPTTEEVATLGPGSIRSAYTRVRV